MGDVVAAFDQETDDRNGVTQIQQRNGCRDHAAQCQSKGKGVDPSTYELKAAELPRYNKPTKPSMTQDAV